MLYVCSVPFAETGITFCLSSYSTVCLGVSGHVSSWCYCYYMFNKISVKDEYLTKVLFLQYSELLDYLVYCFPPECIGWKSAVLWRSIYGLRLANRRFPPIMYRQTIRSVNIKQLRVLNPRANYTDRHMLAKLVPTLRIEGATWSAWWISTTGAAIFFCQLAPQLY
jgi:hypothetical protein